MPTTKDAPILSEPIVLEWHDPRTVSGEPAAAAEAGVRQLLEIARLMAMATGVAETMLRNAVMSEGLEWNIDNNPMDWWNQSWQKSRLDSAAADLEELRAWALKVVMVWSDGQ
ncbi:hypothetical protein UFOVP1328_12 [uncultured Caudovirales phage]|uniref:Uncharacterized protein n=1 Tax=uncultured Caudovirales phage TaxID=2100421 RepID=A0A6J5QLZ3_9CAUD|nr:hypothetical protein UFOVP1084_4 [uncultured Caudovirales phage]CAB4199037.1 hypothetical protein UFOVP1328_12 [uncultured Caudovirales phage]CAB5228410.1 hypothetical protein UFOVP1532_43 [uncultured Caudovirales phage]